MLVPKRFVGVIVGGMLVLSACGLGEPAPVLSDISPATPGDDGGGDDGGGDDDGDGPGRSDDAGRGRGVVVGVGRGLEVPVTGAQVEVGRLRAGFAGVKGGPLKVDVAPTDGLGSIEGLPVGAQIVVEPFEIAARGRSGQAVRSLPPKYEVVPSDIEAGIPAFERDVVPGLRLEIDIGDILDGADVGSVGLWTRESPVDEWVRLASYVDEQRSLVVGESDHLSEFVVVAEVASLTSPRVTLDPDSRIGHAVWGSETVWETDFSVPLAGEVKARLEAECRADVLVTRDESSPDVISHDVRVGQINDHGSVVAATLAHNTFLSTPWGDESNGGLATWAKTGDPGSQSFAGNMVSYWNSQIFLDDPSYLNNQSLSSQGVLFSPSSRYSFFDGVTGSHVHVELGFIDHNIDWPVIRDEHLSALADVVFLSIRDELERQGYSCFGVGACEPPFVPQIALEGDR